jgi:heme A synthase
MKAGEHWDYLGKYFHRFDAVIGVVIVAGAAWFFWTHWKHRMRAA